MMSMPCSMAIRTKPVREIEGDCSDRAERGDGGRSRLRGEMAGDRAYAVGQVGVLLGGRGVGAVPRRGRDV